VLKGIISLNLVPRSDQPGLIAAVEILRETPKITKSILEGNIPEIEEEMQKSVSYFKMQTMNQSLIALVLNGVIKKETALAASTNPGELDIEIRKFLYAAEHGIKSADEEDAAQFMGTSGESKGEDAMALPLSDYSKIVELRNQKLYDESGQTLELAKKVRRCSNWKKMLGQGRRAERAVCNCSVPDSGAGQDETTVHVHEDDLEGKILNYRSIQQLTPRGITNGTGGEKASWSKINQHPCYHGGEGKCDAHPILPPHHPVPFSSGLRLFHCSEIRQADRRNKNRRRSSHHPVERFCRRSSELQKRHTRSGPDDAAECRLPEQGYSGFRDKNGSAPVFDRGDRGANQEAANGNGPVADGS
jgi:hypothetical protein